jgi:hypothetical protein
LVAHAVGFVSDEQPSPQVALLAFQAQPWTVLQADCEVAAVAQELEHVVPDEPDEVTRQLGFRWHAALLDDAEHSS